MREYIIQSISKIVEKFLTEIVTKEESAFNGNGE
jgi:hypothetical protein